MYANKAQRCIRAASLELPLRTRNLLSTRQQGARYATSGKSTLPDWSSVSSTPVRRAVRLKEPPLGHFETPEENTADETLSDKATTDAQKSVEAPPIVNNHIAGARKRRRERHEKYHAWLAEKMAQDESLKTISEMARKEMYWKEVECHYLPDEFMPLRLRKNMEKKGELPPTRKFVVRRTSQGTLKPQYPELQPSQPNFAARSDVLETSKKTAAPARRRWTSHEETVKEIDASGASENGQSTLERTSHGTLKSTQETQSPSPHLKSEARYVYLDTSLDHLSPRERALQLQLARKEMEALRIKNKQVAFEQQYRDRCSWCGSPAHTRQRCALLQADIEDGLCHVADGRVYVGRPWEGGPPIFKIKGLGEGTPLRNRLPRNPRPDLPKVQLVGATGRPGTERPGTIRKLATGVSDPFSAPPATGVAYEMDQSQSAWPTQPVKAPSPVRYFASPPVDEPEEVDAARLLPPKIKPELEIGDEVVPIRKVPIEPGPPKDAQVRARDDFARRQERRQNPVVREEIQEEEMEEYSQEAEIEIEVPAEAEELYHTDLDASQIYEGPITSLKPSTLREQAIEPALPLLIRHPSSPDLESLASASGLRAIHAWFNAPPSPTVTPLQLEEYTPFTRYLTSPSRSQIPMPYEFLTPTIPTINDGTHDLLSSFLFPANPAYVRYMPPPGTLSSLLEKCLEYLSVRPHLDTEIWYEEIARYTSSRRAFLDIKDGRPLSDVQWKTLQKWGPLFQKFNSFQAPLELLLKASSPFEESGSAAPSLPGLYIAQAQLADLPVEMQAMLPLPRVLKELYKDVEGRKREEADVYGANLWMGTPPTFTPLHKDPNPNFFVQMRGRKVIRLLSPSKGQGVFARVHRLIREESEDEGGVGGGAIRGEEMMQGLEMAELEKAVWPVEEGGGQGPVEKVGETVVLNPGDAVYIPKGWWHSVRSLGEGLNASVNWWFR